MKTMASHNFEYNNQIITINGVNMTMAQYQALKRKKARENKIKERNARVIPLLPPYIAKLYKDIKLVKSLVAYSHNGYRQWGVIVNDILGNAYIQTPFTMFVAKANDVNKCIKKIENIGKKNDKDIFAYIEKLTYLLDDMKSELDKLGDGVSASGILHNPCYKGKECIYGVGRRLGLKELMSRSCAATIQMRQAIEELTKMVTDGVDVMEYTTKGKMRKD